MAKDIDLDETEMQAMGQQFVAALTERDFDSLQAIFQPGVRARLLTTPGLVTPLDAKGVITKFRQWFADATFFEVRRMNINCVGRRLGIFYQIRLHDADGWSVLEQQTYSSLENGQIELFDLICSGFEPIPAMEGHENDF